MCHSYLRKLFTKLKGRTKKGGYFTNNILGLIYERKQFVSFVLQVMYNEVSENRKKKHYLWK